MQLILILALVGLLPSSVGAATACLRVQTGREKIVVFPTSLGNELRLGFQNSLYGSQVEEQFRIAAHGIQILKFRYAEERLVEFYGHEAARRERGWWVVEGDGREIATLDLRLSPDSEIHISLGPEIIALSEMVEPGGRLRLSVSPCEKR